MSAPLPGEIQLSANEAQVVIFDLKIDDNELLGLIRSPIRDSEAYWNDTFKLKKVRHENMNLWLPNHWKDKDVYDFQEEYLYQDPRIFTAVESIASVVNSRIPQPDVMPGQDNVISKQIATDVQKVLFAHSTKYQTPDIFRIAARNLLLKRVGFVKLRWDPSRGEHGDVVPEHVSPEDVVVDQDARWGDIPRFIAQRIKNKTGEELIAMFPDQKQAILALLGAKRQNSKGDLVAYKSMLGKKKNIWEVWFKYYDEESGKYSGGLAYVDEMFQTVLGKMRNPNWNYEDENTKGECSNLLDFPEPPFIPLNYLNDGTSYIDLTTLVEQAAPLQRILDRRGFQIMENAEMAGSGLIFNTQMIKKEDIAKLTGSPDERIGVKGNVNQAVMRIAPPPLPQYVIEDKQDARNEMDNIFATHDITRGQNSDNVTLGQDQLQVSQDYTRMGDIARAVERMATKYYRYLVQMMKVYYTDEHWFWAAGEDGQFDRVMMKSDMIEDGIDVSVEADSTLPPNKKDQMTFAMELAPLGLIDPLSMFEVGSGGVLPSPKKMLERLVKWKMDPMSFVQDTQDADFDRLAFMDIQVLLRGEMPKERDLISPEYLSFLNKYMTSNGEFMHQPDKTKLLFIEWAHQCTVIAQRQMQAMMSQLPTQQDMQNANQQAIQQKQTVDQLQPSQPPQPGAPSPGGAPAPSPAGSGGSDLARGLIQAQQQGNPTPPPTGRPQPGV
jgi:hypothetical protein